MIISTDSVKWVTQQIVYEPNGNITQIPSIGSMKYANTAKPYQVTMFTPIGTDVQIRNQQLTYTSFQRPNSIVEDGISASFVYDADGYRVKMNLMQGTTPLLTRYYLDNQYEIDAQKNIERLYLDGDTYSAPAVYIKVNGSWKVYYICRDYLGSITHIANADGTLKQELSYDAWGRLRNPSTQVVHESRQEPELFLVRGYTGHEHLALFGLINMNARLYDPVLGRFLSPDPYVQIPNFTQNFNRYSYCLNNPLIYKDENGEWIHLLIGAIIGGAVNWATHGFKFNAKGLGYFAVGAVAGALGAGIGAGISSALPIMGNTAGGFAAGFWGTSAATTATSSFVSGALIGGGAGASSGFVSGIGNGLIDDNNFGIALRQGALYGIGGAISGALIGGVLSGADAVIHHRNFWNGSKVTNTDVLADAKLPRIIQNSDMNCGPATSEANTGISQNDYRSFLVKNYKYEINQPVRPIDMNNSIEALTGRTVHPFLSNLPKDVEGAKQVTALLNSGHRFIISSGTGTTVNHVTALNKISVLTIQKVSGATVQKVVYQVMNPAGGTFENIGARSMDFIWRISR